MHNFSSFVTLTYDDIHIHPRHHLCDKDLTKFLKRLRRRLGDEKVRYYAVGEYGDLGKRPHYHLALFNFDIRDHELIDLSWQRGLIHVGDLNKDSARYITGYVVNKTLKRHDSVRIQGRPREFARMSLNPGIGASAIDKLAANLGNEKYYSPKPLHQFNYSQKNSRPLGRYLSSRFNKAQGVTEDQLEDDFSKYQDALLQGHLTHKGFDYHGFLQEYESQRKALMRRHKLLKKKRVF